MRIVCIGGWGHFPMALEGVAQRPDCQVVGIAPAYDGEDLTPLHESVRTQWVAELFPDWLGMIDRLKPEVAIISTRMDQIAPVAIEAARAGCHLICEKPLALTADSLAALRRQVEASGVKLMAMHTMRDQPAFIAARDLMRQGRLGEPVLVNARKSYRWGTRPSWFGERLLYGGTIPWIGIHGFDMIHFITGRHMGQLWALHGNRAHPDFPTCEDHALIMGRLDGGAGASISIDFCRPDTSPTHGDDWIRVVGTRGVLEANASRGFCRIITDEEGEWEEPLSAPGQMFASFLEGLAGGAQAGLSSVLSTSDSFDLTLVALAAREAADQNCPVEIDRTRQTWRLASSPREHSDL